MIIPAPPSERAPVFPFDATKVRPFDFVRDWPDLPEHVISHRCWWPANSIGAPQHASSHHRASHSKDEGYTRTEATAIAHQLRWEGITAGTICYAFRDEHKVGMLDVDSAKVKDGPSKQNILDDHAKLVAAFADTFTEVSQSGNAYHIFFLIPDEHELAAKRSNTKLHVELFRSTSFVQMTGNRVGTEDIVLIDAESLIDLERYFPRIDASASGPREQGNGEPMIADELRSRLRNTEPRYAAFLDGPAHPEWKGNCNLDLADFGQILATYTAGCENQREVMEDVIFSSWFALEHTPVASKDNSDRFRNKGKVKFLLGKQFDKFIAWGDKKHADAALLVESSGVRNLRASIMPNTPPPPTKSGGVSEPVRSTAVPPRDGERRLVMVTADEIIKDNIDWLWPQRFALGRVSLIAGKGGVGKSQLTMKIAATVTKGTPWPNGEGSPDAGAVIVLSCEDDLSTTVAPRLEAAGADMKKVLLVQGTETVGRDVASSLSLRDDVGLLAAEIERRGDVKLLIIDPISAYLEGKDGNAMGDTRDALTPLQLLAEKYNIAVIMITHLRKTGNSGSVVEAIMGSGAFVHVARSAFVVLPDPDDDDLRLFGEAKNNLGQAGSLSFAIEGATVVESRNHKLISTSRVAFGDNDERSMEDAFRSGNESNGGASKRKETRINCMAQITELLRNAGEGGLSTQHVISILKDQNFAEGMVRKCLKNEVRYLEHRSGAGADFTVKWTLHTPLSSGDN